MPLDIENSAKESGYQLAGERPKLYEQWWVPALMGPCAEDLVDAADLQPGDNVLDIACGTGVVARAAMRRGKEEISVAGTDLNEGMIDAARSFSNKGAARKISWTVADASHLPFETSTFDVILCQQGLQFMPDRIAVFNEAARVLCSGGRFVASVWKSGSPFGDALRKALGDWFGPEAIEGWNEPGSLGNRHALLALASEAGFKGCHVGFDVKTGRHPRPEDFVAGVIGTTSSSERFADLPVSERKRLIASVLGYLQGYIDYGGLAYPVECCTLTAQA